jgi:hypothetical protein
LSAAKSGALIRRLTTLPHFASLNAGYTPHHSRKDSPPP